MIIVDEKKYAEDLLVNGFVKFMSLRDLSILAKYYLWQGLSPYKIEEELVGYCLKYNPEYNKVKNDWRISKAIATAKKEGIRIFSPIMITESEIAKIRSIDNLKYQRVLFVMLVVAKIMKFATGIQRKRKYKTDDLIGYFFNYKFSDATKLAKVNLNKKQKEQAIYDLVNLHMVEVTKYGKFRICYSDDSGLPFLSIDDPNNIIGFFPYFCEVCGARIDKKNNRHKMCADCWREKEKNSIRERVKKYRNKNVTV